MTIMTVVLRGGHTLSFELTPVAVKEVESSLNGLSKFWNIETQTKTFTVAKDKIIYISVK